MRGMLLICLYLLALHAHAGVVVSERDALRYRTETDPRGLIANMRQQLDQRGGNASPAKERDLLWLMGTAAVNDDTALTEAVLRLDSLAAAQHFDLAAASAGFLRSRQLIATGMGDGIGEALRAAAKVQNDSTPAIHAWAEWHLLKARYPRESGDPVPSVASKRSKALGSRFRGNDEEHDFALK